MWRIFGNMLAAILFGVVASLALAPIVLWLLGEDSFTENSLFALFGVAGLVFLAILFTPKSKGAFRRGARISSFAFLSIPIPLGLLGWQGVMVDGRQGDARAFVSTVLVLGFPLLVVMLIAIVLGLLLLLVSRQKVQPKDQSK